MTSETNPTHSPAGNYAEFIHLNADKSALYRAILNVFVAERALHTRASAVGGFTRHLQRSTPAPLLVKRSRRLYASCANGATWRLAGQCGSRFHRGILPPTPAVPTQRHGRGGRAVSRRFRRVPSPPRRASKDGSARHSGVPGCLGAPSSRAILRTTPSCTTHCYRSWIDSSN
jgi:hypothetical protein